MMIFISVCNTDIKINLVTVQNNYHLCIPRGHTDANFVGTYSLQYRYVKH